MEFSEDVGGRRKRKRVKIVIFCIVIVAVACAGVAIFRAWYWPAANPIPTPEPVAEFINLKPANYEKDSIAKTFAFTFQDEKIDISYRVYAPEDYQKRQYPTLVYFSGSGSIGTDNLAQVRGDTMLKNMTEIYHRTYPAILIAPQLPLDEAFAREPEVIEAFMGIIKQTEKEYNADKSRLYVTGFSMGGDITYGLLEKYADKIAAAAVVCGGRVDMSKIANFKNVPLWIFHGNGDMTYGVKTARDVVAALKKLGDNVRYTEYQASHGIWNKAYSEPELQKWLFAQKLESK